MKQNNQSGRTMLEMLGVLAIMGIITYGAIAGINYGMSSYKINQTYSEVQDIIQGVEDLYSWSKGYPLDGDELMRAVCKNDIFSDSSSCTNGENITVRGSFGDMQLVPVDVGEGVAKNFAIHIRVADSTDCTRLVQMDWKANNIKCTNESPNDNSDNCTCSGDGPFNLYFSPQ